MITDENIIIVQPYYISLVWILTNIRNTLQYPSIVIWQCLYGKFSEHHIKCRHTHAPYNRIVIYVALGPSDQNKIETFHSI